MKEGKEVKKGIAVNAVGCEGERKEKRVEEE